VKDLAKSFDKVGGVQKELSQLGAGLGEVVGSTEAMAGNLGDSTETLSGVGRDIGGTRKATKGMARVMRRVEETLASSGKETSESMARVGVGIEGMNEALASQRKELGTSLAELNSNMTKFLKMMCVLLTSEPECS
jgi:methyl-accepting chemotaxis protein